ncbi:hypothetical protein TNCV_4131821 [Trichonephila clavipes]|nr:hypothetical protein TNCV_4131821 [Trichonephila clavipes]
MFSSLMCVCESRFSLKTDFQRVPIRRKQGIRYHISMDVYGDGGVMVWYDILDVIKDLLAFLKRTLTCLMYMDEIFGPTVMFFKGTVGIFFYDDNACPNWTWSMNSPNFVSIRTSFTQC